MAKLGNPARAPGHQFHEIAESLDQEYADLIAVVTDAIGQRFLDTYVTSFFESGDLLSEWRGYAPGCGYAIEFDTEQLAAATRVACG